MQIHYLLIYNDHMGYFDYIFLIIFIFSIILHFSKKKML